MKFPTRVDLVNIVAGDSGSDRPAGSALSIIGDKQLGHDLALALMRLEQTTMNIPDSLRDLRLKLDAELVGDPASVRYRRHWLQQDEEEK